MLCTLFQIKFFGIAADFKSEIFEKKQLTRKQTIKANKNIEKSPTA